ncbi:2-hydroxyacyl-CoA dehydratase family protein [Pelotomaculum terephthalicicum JT]|uniref:double-cubane-cluster-containing anaerobic reductase n=1 Tax=Pelotomaculum terephthalicicum TaxID=206393 RepID=UPI001F03A70C|nr:double-cubane-cluster-containing anaerobic reductase [Pelotomaculum terephthalicicum]MCG9967408.1 2-hydroxyacyl-CoA dehydratase family protein [Pelotomaculum terephthalicicum JT]
MEQKKQIIDRFKNARSDAVQELNRLKKEGAKIAGYYCTYTPTEIILAAGAVPLRLCNSSDQYVQEGEVHLPRNLCAIVKSSFGEAVSGKSPYFEAADLVVGETTCDGKKKMYEYLRELKPTHIMQLPQKNTGHEESLLWINEMRRLKSRLEQEFEVDITIAKLKDAIKQKNSQRLAVKEFYEDWRAHPGVLMSSEAYSILGNFDYRLDREKALEDLYAMIRHIKSGPPDADVKEYDNSPRILLTGCLLGEKMTGIINIIEKAGGNIVCVETCDWLKGTGGLVNEDMEPFSAIAEKYLRIPCPVMSPNHNRMELVARLIDDYQVDGVIDFVLRACLTYSVETVPLRRLVKDKKHTGYMSLETNLAHSESGQLNTRVSAFIEMLSI